MKCDKLSVYCKTTCTPNGLYYDKSEADTAIAELKQKLAEQESETRGLNVRCGLRGLNVRVIKQESFISQRRVELN